MVGTIAIAKARPFKIRPSKSPDFRSPLYCPIIWKIVVKNQQFFSRNGHSLSYDACNDACKNLLFSLHNVSWFLFQIKSFNHEGEDVDLNTSHKTVILLVRFNIPKNFIQCGFWYRICSVINWFTRLINGLVFDSRSKTEWFQSGILMVWQQSYIF